MLPSAFGWAQRRTHLMLVGVSGDGSVVMRLGTEVWVEMGVLVGTAVWVAMGATRWRGIRGNSIV